ncbi:MAG: hypothetical protein JO323_06760 [Acidobacteriia bacterium]|nr:hypothetical protein [Terriglobia bacterium]
MSKRVLVSLLPFLAGSAVTGYVLAQAPATPRAAQEKKGPARPPLFFREEWKQVPGGGEHAVTLEAAANTNLELKLYGPSGKDIQLTGAAGDDSNPIHLWTGLCESNCGAALRDKNNFVDLTGLAKIRWLTKVSGFHQVHPMVKLANGTWLVGDHADGSTVDWNENEFSVADVRWLRLDVAKILPKGIWVEKPDLSRVDEVGFTDLMPGSGHGPGGWSDVAWIEVYGKPVKRDAGGAGQ